MREKSGAGIGTSGFAARVQREGSCQLTKAAGWNCTSSDDVTDPRHCLQHFVPWCGTQPSRFLGHEDCLQRLCGVEAGLCQLLPWLVNLNRCESNNTD